MYSRVDEDFPFGKGKRARERERERAQSERIRFTVAFPQFGYLPTRVYLHFRHLRVEPTDRLSGKRCRSQTRQKRRDRYKVTGV